MKRIVGVALKTVALLLAAASLASTVFLYTMPVPISDNTPQNDNARTCDRLLGVRKALFIGAHPDDIEFYSAGLVHLLERRGAEVVFAVATRGGKGRIGRAKRKLESLRTQDQLHAARILGGVRVVFFDYPDKQLASHIKPLARDLIKLIRTEQPNVVLSWDADFIYNPHPDHVAAALAAEQAIYATNSRACFYGTREPNLWLGYGSDVFRIKLKALRAHRTETPWPYFIFARRFLVKKSTEEGKKIGAEYAEVFRLTGEWMFG